MRPHWIVILASSASILASAGIAQTELPALARAQEVRDSLRLEWSHTEGFEHAVLSEQLGVWTWDPDYIIPGGWDDRTQAMYELALLSADRFEVKHPGHLIHDGERVEATGVHWSKGLRDLRRMLLTEQFEPLSQSYFMVWPVLPAVRDLANGELALRRQDAGAALTAFKAAEQAATHPRVAGEAAVGVARALYEQQQYQASLDTLLACLSKGGFGVEALQSMGLTLIRLGRVREATALFELALEVNPLHERAHYYLGNGYAPYNYTQLSYEYPHIVPEGVAGERLESAEQLLREGKRDLAVATLQALALSQPVLIEPRLILAEMAWMDGNDDTAERLLTEALESCPDYGRLHAEFARVQELRRLEQSSRRFAVRDSILAGSIPVVEGIETFISDWDALTPDFQKVVAEAVQPWAAFIPALNAAGQTHYIKPMYQKLSEAPHLESLRDQRIDLDSRLWDDVRGVGGFYSVTGVEDVRRMTFGGYNTLVHELTHQVHGIFTPEQTDRVEELYRAAKLRDDNGEPAFMSRYQASTVWEYFAEGVNAYVTPRIDKYDEREILRDRLDEIDPALEGFAGEMLAVTDVRENVAVARSNGALQSLEYGEADSSWLKLEQIGEKWAERPYVLAARAAVASILDRDSTAMGTALRYAWLYPRDGDAWTGLASALQFAPGAGDTLPDSLGTPLEVMRTGLRQVKSADEIPARLALAGYAHDAGSYADAIVQADTVLIRQPGQPEALWQRANSRAGLALSADGADSAAGDSAMVDTAMFARATADFERAVQERSGVMELRLDYARALLLAGRLDDADRQIGEAESLQPDDPLPMTYRAWWLRRSGETKDSDALFAEALSVDPAPDDTRVLAAYFGLEDARSLATVLAQWEREGPRYVYNARQYRYEARQVVRPWMRALLPTADDSE